MVLAHTGFNKCVGLISSDPENSLPKWGLGFKDKSQGYVRLTLFRRHIFRKHKVHLKSQEDGNLAWSFELS